MTTHKDRILAAIKGELIDRPPVALWRHFPVDDQSPEALAKSTLHFQKTYDFDLVKVTDIREIISYGIMATPGLIINGVVKSVGTVPKDPQLLQWLKEQSNAS